MITKIDIPKVSANVEEETVTAWLKKEGDQVQKGEPIAELTTDKASFDLEAPRPGVLRKILAREKSVLPVGYVIALLGDDKEPLPDVSGSNRKLLDTHRQRLRRKPARSGGKAGKRRRSSVRATPAARRLAREMDVDLEAVQKAGNVEVVTEELVREHTGKDVHRP